MSTVENGVEPAKGEAGLRFDRPDGPLVVVCGLHGGAGTSMIAYALATRAARESSRRVLLVETPASAGDQSDLAGISPLWELGDDNARAHGDEHSDIPVTARIGRGDSEGAGWRAYEATSRYGLTVVDAGTLRSEEASSLLRVATHVVWTTIATDGAADRARRRLRQVAALAARQALLVRAGARTPRRPARTGELRKVAEDFCDRLIYVTDIPGTIAQILDLEERRMLQALTGLAGFIGARPDAGAAT